MNILNQAVEAYIGSLHEEDDAVLKEMEALAKERDFPIIGRVVGRLLSMAALMIGARRVLELGSGFGFSAFWFARGMPAGGEVLLTDYRDDNLESAARFLQRPGFACRFQFLSGDALENLKSLEGPFDIILNDIDKTLYPTVANAAVPLLPPGGLLISDNTLWEGEAAAEPTSEEAAAIREYNRLVFSHPDLLTSLIPLRDGVTISRRKS